jgi:hypothetical protein
VNHYIIISKHGVEPVMEPTQAKAEQRVAELQQLVAYRGTPMCIHVISDLTLAEESTHVGQEAGQAENPATTSILDLIANGGLGALIGQPFRLNLGDLRD